MADLVRLTIDGREVTAAPGTLLIEAARRAGIEIPAFCYYPGLSLQAACRMCLVEIEKAPKLQTACTVPVGEGMVVRTNTPKVHDARRSMLEFLLTNHPLDCPVCDKGGECELQDMVFRYGASFSRFREEKRHTDEEKWSPVVYYDGPRCILCYRCVRVCNEGMDVSALAIVNRGGRTLIGPNAGGHLDCEQCGMCIDICPVGALTSGSYRHQARPWELHYVPTICTHCGDGCKTTLSVRNNRVLRGNNRVQSGINGEFLCIKGRYAFDFLHHPERLTQPLVRQEGKLAPATWAQALRAVAARFRQLLEQGSAFGIIGSNHAGNEAAYLLQKFARAGLRTNNIDHHRTADYAALIAALARSGVRPADRLAGSRDLLTARAVLLIGNNPTEQHPLLAWNMRTNVRLNKGRLYVVNHRAIKLERQATATLRIEEGRAGALLDFLAGQTTAGQPPALQPWNEFRDRLRAESDLLVVFGDEIKGDGIARLVAFGNTLGGVTRYIALGDYNNSRGASDMGLLPGSLPGYAPVEDAVVRARFEAEWNVTLPPGPGLALDEMIAAAGEGRLGALYVVGANPLKRYNLNAASSFLVVQDMFLTETARQADVVLPAAAVYEVNGTVTNTCGELQRIRQALGTNGPRADLEIIGLIAKETGISLGPVGSEEVFDEIRRLVNGYNVAMAGLAAGEAVPTAPADGRDASLGRPDLVHSSGDTLFTSGTLGQYSDMLEAVRRH